MWVKRQKGEQLKDEDKAGGGHEDDVKMVDAADQVQADKVLEDALESLFYKYFAKK